ncbi:D-alanine--D-alanine ligase [Caloramator sp. E03]|uniref:D-alanine--D-alanine ligase family protein n=1 Tax=Caloramator sp. E03 TaxID=2576307 RepID=UPI0011108848|nr:D-alanine--D-alanine ligase family protein [Caloramator sp. E03]QCX34584.1 D-alanine--D-alanine ligase [Caloramator sp. E03]
MSKKKVAVIFGGRSVEHEVSVITGIQVIENIDKNKYDVVPVYVSKSGDWYTGEELLDIKNYKDINNLLSKSKKAFLSPVPSIKALIVIPEKKGFFKKDVEYIPIDVIFPAFHGAHGEDGTMQGLFELADIPYVGSGVTGSAVGMDKIIMKDIFKANGLPIVNYIWFTRDEYEKNKDSIVQKIESQIGYPSFVKPANLGSSIGIGKAKNTEDLLNAIEVATKYDRRIIVEKAVENCIEINCSVIGFDNDFISSVCEQPISIEEFLSFDDKYMRGSSSKGMKSTVRKIPAPISEEKTKEIKDLSIDAFRMLDCSGVARIDFLVEKDSMKVYVNEINTIPGSISFYLWEPCGIKFKELIDKLIEIAIKRHDEYNKNIYTFDTALLAKASAGAITGGKVNK